MAPLTFISIEGMRKLDSYCPGNAPYKKSSVLGSPTTQRLSVYAAEIGTHLQKKKRITREESWYLFFICRKLDQLGDAVARAALEATVAVCTISDPVPFHMGTSTQPGKLIGLENAVKVSWKFLPSPENLSAEELLDILQAHFSQHSSGSGIIFELKRIAYALSLKPKGIYVGSEEFAGYYAFLFPDQTVLFECPAYGNAAYVVKGDWRALSQQYKTQLKKKGVRVIHGTRTWKKRIRNAIAAI